MCVAPRVVYSGTRLNTDFCDFVSLFSSHDRVACPPGSLNEKRLSSAGKDNPSIVAAPKLEKEQKATRPSNKSDVREAPKDEANEDKAKSSNFYPINWRVVGGGVKIGVNSESLLHNYQSILRYVDLLPSSGCRNGTTTSLRGRVGSFSTLFGIQESV